MKAATIDLATEVPLISTSEREVGSKTAGTERAQAEASQDLSALNKVRRLARGLAPALLAPGAQVVVLAELGLGQHSALWLTAALGNARVTSLGLGVTVLAVGTPQDVAAERDMRGKGRHSTVEFLEADRHSKVQFSLALERRLQELESRKGKVLVHLSEGQDALDLLGHVEACAGVVLLSRAGRTRKAAVESFHSRTRQLGVPLLGAVLLEREYPIPETLYHLL